MALNGRGWFQVARTVTDSYGTVTVTTIVEVFGVRAGFLVSGILGGMGKDCLLLP